MQDINAIFHERGVVVSWTLLAGVGAAVIVGSNDTLTKVQVAVTGKVVLTESICCRKVWDWKVPDVVGEGLDWLYSVGAFL